MTDSVIVEWLQCCSSCNCDYPADVFAKHAEACTGVDDKMLFIIEHAKRKYSRSSIKKFVTFLQNAYDVNISGRDVLRTMNEQAFNIWDWISFENEVLNECQVCCNDVPVDDLFVASCVDAHRVCYNCLYVCSVSMGSTVLACPVKSCNHPLLVNEIHDFPFPQQVKRKLVENYEQNLRNTKTVLTCPAVDCDWSIEVSALSRFNVKCKLCETKFCSMCRATSHYRVDCDELPRLTQEWLTCCVQKRGKKRAKEFKKALERLKNDEEKKALDCRRCTNCDRVVTGTENVICGQNKEIQGLTNGCGEPIEWQNAPLYINKLKKQSELEKQVSEASKVAENATHYPYKCKSCNVDIIGLRFECVNCECTSFCESCDKSDATVKHNSTHVFKLVLHGERPPRQSRRRCIMQ